MVAPSDGPQAREQSSGTTPSLISFGVMGRKRLYFTLEEQTAKKREWQEKYAKSERGRRKKAERLATAEAKALAKARYARYRLTEKYRATQARYAATERGKATEAAYQAWIKATQPIRVKARAEVSAAMRRGDIVRPEECDSCQRPCRPDAHHHLGYEPVHWLTVTWLCRRCHKAAHS